jgi:hypothetical protein
METSYVNSDGDMGQHHIESHAKQHDFLLDGEPNIITLTNTKTDEKSQDLALKKAIEQGVKTEEEWKEYNSKLMPSRQKKDYEEYITSLSNNYVKNVKRQIDKGGMNHTKKDKAYQSLKAIDRNHGLAIEGSLYYLGNVDDYAGKSEKELRKYREWQVKTFKILYESSIFQTLNKGLFRAEIDLDERGAIHLQTQSTHYHKNARGRVEMATGACQKEALIELYGSEKELNQRLDLLQVSHEYNDKRKKIGEWRTDAYYWQNLKNLGKFKSATAGKRRMRIPELWRMEQMHALQSIALETAKQDGISYGVTRKYVTEGKHKTAIAYTAEHKAHSKVKTDLNKAHKQANDIVAQAVKISQEKQRAVEAREQKLHSREAELSVRDEELQKQKIQQQKQQRLLKLQQREQAEKETLLNDRETELNRRESSVNALYETIKLQVKLIKRFVRKTVAVFGLPVNIQNSIADQSKLYAVPTDKGTFTKDKHTGGDWALTAIHENPKRFTANVVRDLSRTDDGPDL